MSYDETDRKIIAALRQYGDKRLMQYATITGVPKSTVHERMRKLVANGARCTPLIYWPALGFPLVVYFFIPNKYIEHHSINAARLLSPNSLFLECVFRSVKEAEEFRERLGATRYFTAIEFLKQEGFIPPVR